MASMSAPWAGRSGKYLMWSARHGPNWIEASPEADTEAEFQEWVKANDAQHGPGGWGFATYNADVVGKPHTPGGTTTNTNPQPAAKVFDARWGGPNQIYEIKFGSGRDSEWHDANNPGAWADASAFNDWLGMMKRGHPDLQIRQGGGAGQSTSIIDIIASFRAGKLDRNGAIAAIANVWVTTGLDKDAAMARATADFDQNVSDTPIPTDTPYPVGGRPTDPVLGFAAQRELAFSQSREGRQELFRDYLARLPGAAPLVEAARERAFTPYSQSFEIGQALGTVAPESTFARYLPQEFAPINQAYFRQQLGDVGRLLGGSEPGSQAAAAYREKLLGDPGRQHTMAFEGVRPDIAPALQAGAKEIGSERFGRAQDVNLLASGFGGAQTNPFAQYLEAQGGFAGPTDPEYRAQVERAAGLLRGGQTTGLAEDLRQTLLTDPNRQFDLAFRTQLPSVPFALRPAFGRRAERAFREFGMQDDPTRNPFLAYFAGRGYQF